MWAIIGFLIGFGMTQLIIEIKRYRQLKKMHEEVDEQYQKAKAFIEQGTRIVTRKGT